MPNVWNSKILAVPWGTRFSFVTASTRCNESSGSGWLRLSFSGFLSTASSFSTEKSCAPYPVLLWKGCRERQAFLNPKPKRAGNRNGHSSWLSERWVSPSTCRNEARIHHHEGERWRWASGAPLLHPHRVPGGATRRRVLHTPPSNAERFGISQEGRC